MILKAVVMCARCNHEVDVVQFETSQGFVYPRTKPMTCPECADKMHFGGLTRAQLVKTIDTMTDAYQIAGFFLELAHGRIPEEFYSIGQDQGQKVLDGAARKAKPVNLGGRPKSSETDKSSSDSEDKVEDKA